MLTEESLQKKLHKYLSKVKLAMKSKNYWIGMIISFLLFNIQGLTCYAANTKPNNYSIAHFRVVRDLMVATCSAKLHQA